MEEGNSAPKTYYKYAGFWRRTLAYIIDSFILMLLYIPLFVIAIASMLPNLETLESQSTALPPTFGLTIHLVIIAFFAIYLLYNGILLIKFQTTIGKKLLGMKVVKEDNTKITIGTVILRELIGKWISGMALNLGYLWVGYDVRKRGWHDMVAGTYVVHNKPISKEEYDAQINRKPNKAVLIIGVLVFVILPVLLFLAAIIAAVALIAIDPVAKLETAKAVQCAKQCEASKDANCVNKCLGPVSTNTQTNEKTQEGWVAFNSTAGNFKIDFPLNPTTQTTKESLGAGKPDLTITIHSAEIADGTTYVATTVAYPEFIDVSKPNVILEAVAKGTSDSITGKLVSSTVGTFKGFPSIDYVIQIPDGNLKYRTLLIKRDLYTLGIASPTSDYPDFDKFVNSFEIMGN